MKNKTDFFKEDVIQKKQFIDKNKAGSIPQQNQYSEKEQKNSKINTLKVIKGKVEVFSKIKDSENLDSKSELLIVSERMLSFIKFSTAIFILLFVLFVLKNNGIQI